MKKPTIKSMLILLITVSSVILTACSSSDNTTLSLSPHAMFSGADAVNKPVEITAETRGVWIASVYNINFPSAPDLSVDKLKTELDSIVKNALSYNLNTIFFQVHPASDALYRSDIFPVSEYLYTDGILHFDPLEYMINICRKNGISLYAWINPLRLSTSASDTAEAAIDTLPSGSPGKDSELTVFYGDGKLYLNCGEERVRNLVAEAVKEIASSYDVDGIVFDDYFYPYPVYDENGVPCVFDDSESYKKADTSLSLEAWRRENVNKMIKLCYTEIKKHNPDILFGVAPFGIWQNDNGTNGGSSTSGLESYSELYCDASAWIKGKYIDFISPQLYWKCDSATAPFEELLSFWNRITDGTGVDLIVSHGVYQYESWDAPSGELSRQIEISRKYLSYKGSILYGYNTLINNSFGAADDTVSAFGCDVYYYHSSGYPNTIELSVNNNAVIEGDRIIFDGYSDPNHALTVNGMSVTRSHGGYFKCELTLIPGNNEFIFTCGDTTKSVTVINSINNKTSK